jgi:dephospho-CoA kinase
MADREARRLMNHHPELKHKIKDMFGEQAYGKEGLNREFLAAQLFGDREKLLSMNALVHPVVREDFFSWADQHKDFPYVVEEAAILFESGAYKEMDQTVLVTAPEEIRIGRVMERDGLDRDAVLKRLSHQLKEEELKKRADHLISNDGEHMLLPQVIELHNKLLMVEKQL